jgi:hypothetical protein
MPSKSAHQRLAETVIGVPLVGWLQAQRAEGTGEQVSYHEVAKRLRDATDGLVDVTGETVRAWLDDAKKTAA